MHLCPQVLTLLSKLQRAIHTLASSAAQTALSRLWPKDHGVSTHYKEPMLKREGGDDSL